MTTYIYSYNPHSASAKALADALGIKRIKHHNSKYKPKADDVIINWGCTRLPDYITHSHSSRLNDDYLIAPMTDKLRFFRNLSQDVSELLVPWTTDPEQVKVWLSEGKAVVARTKLTGHSGEGIVILEGAGTEIVEASLYTLYVPKKDEYRVHCVKYEGLGDVYHEIFDIQQKKRKNDVPDEEVDWRVRNLNGGFIYARQDIAVPDVVKDVALQVFKQTNLDFGAVDIIYNDKQKKAYALEVNTAPGLTGTTLEKYVEMFKEIL